ncbi:ankyrin repeat-containing domain protein [Xylariaceae sp. FL1272]|nr:ankyrin repeat-containing domain protein [Xylariaceae sp. FL1272]
MAANRFQATALNHCHKATVLGNIIAIHMLEYLTTASLNQDGLNKLAHDFLEVCRIMWSIEAGLIEFTRKNQALPLDMTQELDRKFQTAHSDFQALDHWLSRSLADERKGKFSKSLKRMFTGNEIPKMREALGKTREGLRMSALMFQWSLGDSKIDESLGIGYTALEAALDRMDNGPSSKPASSSGSATRIATQPSQPSQPSLPPTPPADIHPEIHDDRHMTSSPTYTQITHDDTRLTRRSSMSLPTYVLPLREDSLARPMASRAGASWAGSELLDYHSTLGPKSPSMHRAETLSTRSVTSRVTSSVQDGYHKDLSSSCLSEIESLYLGESPDHGSTKQPKAVRLSANPAKMPRWTPRNLIGAETPSLRTELITAIQDGSSKVVEQLLDRGVSPGPDGNHHPLNLAIRHHDMETVRMLLLFGADPNTPDTDKVLPLTAAVEEGFLDAAAIMLKYGADTNHSATPDCDSAFTSAIVKGDTHFLRLFLIYGADVNYVTQTDGKTVLTKMISKTRDASQIDAVLNYGADANKKSKVGNSPLFEAISAGRADITTSLLNAGANPNLPGPKHVLWPSTYHPSCLKVMLARGADVKRTPGIMELATSINNIESVQILLKAGVNPNILKDGTYTPLCSSIRDNNPDIFHLLLANGADPNIPAAEYPCFKCVTHNRPQFLPFLVDAGADLNSPKGIAETAVRYNNTKALEWLLENGVSPNDAAPESKATPLTTAIHMNKPELVDFLLSKGANPNVRGQDWPVCMAVKHPQILKRLLPALAQPRAFKGVMEMAVAADELESVKLLLAAGVSVEDRNGGVFSPLTTAIRERHKDIVQYLLEEAGADPNAPGEHLPIVKALRRYQAPDTEIIELLLAKGADPNKVYRGHNAVIEAIDMGDAALLRMLIEKWGVDVTAIDDSGRTPIEIAELRGWDEGREILMSGKKAV